MTDLGISLTDTMQCIKQGETAATITRLEPIQEPAEEKVSFPIHLLPKWLQDTANEHSEAYGTPVELWATAFLCGMASVVGKRIHLKHHNYVNYPQLWVIVVGKSGDGKSDAGRVAFKWLQDRDAGQYAKYRAELKEYKDGGCIGRAPRWEQSIIGDTTPEALYTALAYAGNGLLLYRDELSGWFADFGRYNKSGEVGHYLSIFDNQDITINRKHDEPQLIREPLLGIFGTIQPSILSELLEKNNFETSGLAQRFLILNPDFTKKVYKPSGKEPSACNYNGYLEILNLPPGESFGVHYLSKEANEVYGKFYNELEDLREGASDFWATVYAKAQIHSLRLALTVKISRLMDDSSKFLSRDDMLAGIEMAKYFIASLEKFKRKEQKKLTPREIVEAIHAINPNVNQTQLAEMVGMSRVHVNRIIQECKCNRLQFTPSANLLQQRITGIYGCNTGNGDLKGDVTPQIVANRFGH